MVLRTVAPYHIPSRSRSSTYLVRPSTLSTPSLRTWGVPTIRVWERVVRLSVIGCAKEVGLGVSIHGSAAFSKRGRRVLLPIEPQALPEAVGGCHQAPTTDSISM